ncbi:hypothetical protein F7734_38025 [Scytonema sp. UIC 10036]|uniref:hypothetical protein n=1 Tax=Scytonema sp. UIC 10036 TaxID=2304196 RepID=UPI0012DA5967|nr:hypothetical protein [Scytonema sp. UIC 10036]MUG97798.1 hypothetical protein [Scytonema sp. UIC 10036]
MSNIDTAISISDEQLFTELTSEEGAVIEGGALLLLHKATAIKASSDIASNTNGDDVVVKADGKKIHGTVKDVETGETFNINKFHVIDGTASITFFDADVWGNADDYLGGFTVGNSPTNGKKWKRISGSDSIYDVQYEVIA